MDKALSSDDILKVFDNKTKIITYDQLKNYSSIDELLKPYGSVFLLYLSAKNYGHWTLIFRNNKNENEFFDSYGMLDTKILKTIDKNIRKYYNQASPYLSKLLLKDGRKIIYNDNKLQKVEKNINTCGRWCIMRLIAKDIDIDNFNNIFTSQKKLGMGPDELVTYLTQEL